MLTSLRIQNFRSIRDASVKLGQVNLFIGPNNSGKSNFLKGINHLVGIATFYPERFQLGDKRVNELLPRDSEFNGIPTINFTVEMGNTPEPTIKIIIGYVRDGRLVLLKSADEPFVGWLSTSGSNKFPELEDATMHTLRREIYLAPIYKLEPSTFLRNTELKHQILLDENGRNIINFIYYLSQNHRGIFKKLENDFAQCVGELISISTPVDPIEEGKLKLKFFDQNDIGYWADEVSEGVLYFLALLCIVHQPDPPKLLLLEEPEKGIHPRRIKEVMDFIFELAELRDIQIILTSHSPYVVDHFADIPECISVFDRENGETVIRNAGDIITETNEKLAAEGKKPIRYTDSLGEHWVSGFLGGVPV